MKTFARVMGLLFGSAGAHTYPKSEQVAPPPPTHTHTHTHTHKSTPDLYFKLVYVSMDLMDFPAKCLNGIHSSRSTPIPIVLTEQLLF